MRSISVVTALLVLFSAGESNAQTHYGFTTLDRMDRVSRLGGQIGLPVLHGDNFDDVTFLRLEAYGQGVWQLSENAAGIYGHLPMAHAFVSDGDDINALANIEAGGFFVLGTGSADVVFRGGLSLPTAGDELREFLTNVYSGFDRLTDFAGVAPDTLWLRFSVSPIVAATERLTLRFDAGLDVPVDAGDNSADDTLAHVNAGLGVAVSEQVGLSIELVNVGNLSGDGDMSDRFFHTLAFGVRGLGEVQPYFAVVLPLDEDVNDELFVLTAGLQGTFE